MRALGDRRVGGGARPPARARRRRGRLPARAPPGPRHRRPRPGRRPRRRGRTTATPPASSCSRSCATRRPAAPRCRATASAASPSSGSSEAHGWSYWVRTEDEGKAAQRLVLMAEAWFVAAHGAVTSSRDLFTGSETIRGSRARGRDVLDRDALRGRPVAAADGVEHGPPRGHDVVELRRHAGMRSIATCRMRSERFRHSVERSPRRVLRSCDRRSGGCRGSTLSRVV